MSHRLRRSELALDPAAVTPPDLVAPPAAAVLGRLRADCQRVVTDHRQRRPEPRHLRRHHSHHRPLEPREGAHCETVPSNRQHTHSYSTASNIAPT